MNACPKWREELIDHALGGLPAAALQAHLATCAGCSEALEAWRRKAAQIDTGVQQLIAAEPRAQGPERVLTQIQQKWGTETFNRYLIRPDIQVYYKQLG